MTSLTATGYYHIAGDDTAQMDRCESIIQRTARSHGLVLKGIWPDGGRPWRQFRHHVLQQVRAEAIDVLIVPDLSHLSRRPALVLQLVDFAFGCFAWGRLLTCDGSFDSARSESLLCWDLMRTLIRLEEELAYQRDGVTLH